ncbi:hypothetical protein ACFL6W_02335 [Thermodesulfobacteriota bacterium]
MLLANEGFVMDARSAASSRGMPGIRILGTSIPCETNEKSEIEKGIAAAMKNIVASLTRPLTADEKSPRPNIEKPPRITFTGSYEEVNRFFYRKGWTDGLAIAPPTEKAVAEMMTGTDLPPDHIVTRLIPRLGKATVEKIAVNAVMAGALPTHMPVLLAAVKSLMDPRSRFDTFGVSTGSWAPFFIINGPIRNDIHINSGSGALSPGDIANAAIGRAMSLIIKNIGGARKGIEDMGVFGNPGKYTLVLGEYEEESPWEPLHVERGFNKEDSTLTLFLPNTYIQTIPRDTNAKGYLETYASLNPGSMSCILVVPPHAKVLAKEGWTKKRIKEYILKNSNSPFPRAQSDQGTPILPVDSSIDNFMILVTGGPGAWIGLMRSAGGWENSFVTMEIDLPRNWDKLVAKYKNMVPSYVGY